MDLSTCVAECGLIPDGAFIAFVLMGGDENIHNERGYSVAHFLHAWRTNTQVGD